MNWKKKKAKPTEIRTVQYLRYSNNNDDDDNVVEKADNKNRGRTKTQEREVMHNTPIDQYPAQPKQ